MLGRSATSLWNLAAAKFAERHEFASMSFNLALYRGCAKNPLTQIEANSSFKNRVVGTLKAAGKETFKEAIDHLLVNILWLRLKVGRKGNKPNGCEWLHYPDRPSSLNNKL